MEGTHDDGGAGDRDRRTHEEARDVPSPGAQAGPPRPLAVIVASDDEQTRDTVERLFAERRLRNPLLLRPLTPPLVAADIAALAASGVRAIVVLDGDDAGAAALDAALEARGVRARQVVRLRREPTCGGASPWLAVPLTFEAFAAVIRELGAAWTLGD